MAAFIVTSSTNLDPKNPRCLTYAADAGTAEQAVELVRPLVEAGAKLEASGQTLSPIAAAAIGLRPGRAKLV